MKEWHGYRDDLAKIGDNIDESQNISFRVKGELRRRPGLGLKKQLTAQSMGAIVTDSGSWIVANNGGTLTGYDLDNDTTFTVASGLTSSPRGNWANANGQLYFSNGVDPVQVISDGATAAQDAGITGPASASSAGSPAAGTVTAGVHLIRYRYKNSATGYYSNPSPDLEFTAAGSQNIPLTLVTSADAKANQMVIEMTLAAGDEYFVVATITAATSYTINISDALLALNQNSNVYSAPDGYGFDVPPAQALMIEHRSRLWFLAEDGTLYWSRALFPEALNILDWARKVNFGRSDTPTALFSYYSDIYLGGLRGMSRLAYDTDPAASKVTPVPGDMGIYNQRCYTVANGDVFGFGPTGAWRMSDLYPRHISRPIDQTFQDLVDETQSEKFHVTFDPQERAVYFFFVRTGDTSPKDAICFETLTQNWSLRTFRNQMQSSLVTGDAQRPTRSWLGDNDGGWIWRQEEGKFDGLPPTMTSGVLTVGTSSTTTAINITTPALPTSTYTPVGAMVYNEDTDETVRVVSNTANQMTVSPAFASAPGSGTLLFLASIEVVGVSEWYIPGNLNRTFNPPRLQIDDYVTGGGVELRVSIFNNFSATKIQLTEISSDDTNPLGVTLDNGDAVIDTSVVGPTGVTPSDDSKALRWKFIQRKPQGVMKILDISWQDDRPPTAERTE